jgi:hypothetical protein
MLFRNPHLFAFALAAIGLGLIAWYGEQLSRLPAWSEAEIEQSVELNLALDLQRRGPHLRPEGERLDALRQALRQEVEAEIRHDRRKLERWVGFGALLLVFGLGQWATSALKRRAPLN